jgi:Secretion system C-terminal sorting domain
MLGTDNILTTKSTFASTNYDVIPMQLKANVNGQYTISVSGIAYANHYDEVLLEDLYTDKTIDLKADLSYTFEVNNESKNSTNRFVLHLKKGTNNVAQSTGEVTDKMVTILGNGTSEAQIAFNVNTAAMATISIYNAIGELVSEINTAVQNQTIPIHNLSSGAYLVKVQMGTAIISEKVVISNL